MKWNVNRDSPEDKLRDFLEWMKAVKRDTIHNVSVLDFSEYMDRISNTHTHTHTYTHTHTHRPGYTSSCQHVF